MSCGGRRIKFYMDIWVRQQVVWTDIVGEEEGEAHGVARLALVIALKPLFDCFFAHVLNVLLRGYGCRLK